MSKRTKTEELETLLRESLPFVVLHSRSGDYMSTADYQQSLRSVRSKYEPQLRDRISSLVPELEDDRLRGALLNFLTTEMMDYLHEGRLRAAGDILRRHGSGGAPIDLVLRNILRRALADGETTSAQAFTDCISTSSCTFSEFFALPGLQVDGILDIFDGVQLVPLSSDPNQLPAYLPRDDMYPIFVRRAGEVVTGIPWVRTLLRVDYDVSPIFVKASKIISQGPDSFALFDLSLKSRDLQEVEWPTFFQALSMVCQRPIQPMLIWRTFIEPYEIFDLDSLIGPKQVEWHFITDFQSYTPPLVTSHIEELQDLYWGIVRLPPENRARLQVPINRWIASVGQRHEVDRMIDLGIAFDSLYLEDNDRGSLGDKLADRASRYLCNNKTERQKLYGHFKRIYNNRSGAVHRGVLREGPTPQEKEDFIRDAQSLCLQTIKIAIARGIPQNSKEWETWKAVGS